MLLLVMTRRTTTFDEVGVSRGDRGLTGPAEAGASRRRAVGALAAAGAWALGGRAHGQAPLGAAGDRPAAAAGGAGATGGGASGLRKAVVISMLPKGMSVSDRFRVAREAGFEGVEAQTVPDEKVALEIKQAAEAHGIRIHSVMNMDHWKFPLSSDDPAEVERSMRGMETSLHNAKLWGADTVLLVPAVVNPKTSYADAYKRSQAQIRKLLPLAAKLKVTIAVEEVWNKFLLSPLEFARYVDELKSPWLRAYFDIGNVVLYGFPQDWIRTLGKRTVRVHVKDFDSQSKKFVDLGDGSVDWPEVRRALREVGYRGWVTAELRDGDAAYLKDVSARLDRLLLAA
jgi:hexulose-6-phosphate isomerase